MKEKLLKGSILGKVLQSRMGNDIAALEEMFDDSVSHNKGQIILLLFFELIYALFNELCLRKNLFFFISINK